MLTRLRRSLRRRPHGDTGGAMLTVVFVGIIVTGMGLAEAGVAAGIDHLRGSGVRHICATCTTGWNTAAPMVLTFQGGQAEVSISQLAAYRPPAVKVGRYLIRAVARTNGATPGRRIIEQTVDVKPFAFPLGVYTAAKVNLGGNVEIQQESFFSGECIDSRSKMTFVPGPNGSMIDPYNDVPAGARSASYITDTNSNTCSTNLAQVRTRDTGAVHRTNTCHETYWADQSALGGPFTSGSCAAKTAGKGDYGTVGSAFSMDVLRDSYGFIPRGLTDDQFALLKARARAAGTWFPAGRAVTIPAVSTVPGSAGYNPIVYIEDQDLSLGTEFNGYAWVNDLSCTLLHPSVLLVIERGSLKLGSSTKFTGNVFVPDGDVAFSGGAELTGTVFTKNLKFVGGGRIGLNDCAAASTHGALLSVEKRHFREIDH